MNNQILNQIKSTIRYDKDTGLLGLFANELGVSNSIRHIAFTISVICMCAFVLPQANIWQRIKKDS